MDGQDPEVGALVAQLSGCKNATQVFSSFVEHLEQAFVGLTHCSLLLFPADGRSAAAVLSQQPAAASLGSSRAGSGGGDAKAAGGGAGKRPSSSSSSFSASSSSAAAAASAAAASELADRWAALKSGSSLDWSNCCTFALLKQRGPVVQPPPAWPVSCTSSYHASVAAQAAVLATSDFAALGPHFVDWKALHEQQGVRSIACLPLVQGGLPVAALTLASSEPGAFDQPRRLLACASALTPFVQLLSYTTRRGEMQRLVNELITPIASQLAQQQQSQLARLGCTVMQDSPPAAAAAPAGIAGLQGASNEASGVPVPANAMGAGAAVASSAVGSTDKRPPGDKPGSNAVLTRRHAAAAANGTAVHGAAAGNGHAGSGPPQQQLPIVPSWGEHGLLPGISVRSRYSAAGIGPTADGNRTVSVRSGHVCSAACAAGEPLPCAAYGQPCTGRGALEDPLPAELDWGDFCFNLISMIIVYLYFSRAALVGESLVAIVLCMGVAAFDVALLIMRWMWYASYAAYGSNMVQPVFHVYRLVVLPVANTWMSWSLMDKLGFRPSAPLIAGAAALLLACMLLGLHIRFFLHAPVQLASVLLAASSTGELCAALFDTTTGLRCVATVSALQLTLGLLLPSALAFFADARPGRSYLPHVQAKRWLLHP